MTGIAEKPTLIRRFLYFWKFKKESVIISNEGPDLFEYARHQAEDLEREEQKNEIPAITEKEKDNKPIAWIRFAGPILGGILGFFLLYGIFSFFKGENKCSVERQSTVYLYNGDRYSGLLHGIENNRINLEISSSTSNKKEFISMADVRKIVLQPPIQEEDSERELTAAERRFLGVYYINVSRHIGKLVIYRHKSGRLGAWLRFQNWGRRVKEHLRSVRVRGDRIRFIRSCNGRECSRIGSGSRIHQVYFGDISENRERIKGTYSGGRNASEWIAKRR